MFNISQLYEEKEKLLKSISQTLTISGANILSITKELEILEKRSDDNIKALALLL